MKKIATLLHCVAIALLCVASAFAQQTPQIKPGIADTITLKAYADNWCVIFINGKMVAVDSIDFLPHNEISVKILPEYPMTIAVLAKDNAEPATGARVRRRVCHNSRNGVRQMKRRITSSATENRPCWQT